MVVTRITVRNASLAPVPRLTISETWYDTGGAIVTGGKGSVNGLLQPGEIQVITISTPYNAKMKSNNYNFSHANGTVKPQKVAKLEVPKDPRPRSGARRQEVARSTGPSLRQKRPAHRCAGLFFQTRPDRTRRVRT